MPEHHPHDHFFRSVFSSSENALGVFRAVLPAEVIAAIEPGSLQLEEGSFVDAELRGQESDLLFRARLAGRETRLHLLMEHQSQVDPLMPLRILRYVVRIWERCMREGPARTTLPAVIPIVLFNGPRRWTGPRSLADMIDLPAELRAALGSYMPALNLLIDDLADQDELALEQRNTSVLARIALVFLKAATDRSDLLVLLERLKPLLDALVALHGGADGLRLVLSYTMSVRDIEPRALVQHVRRVLASKTGEAAMASTYEQILAEGRAEGRAQGRAEEARKILVRLLHHKFGALPAAIESRIESAPLVDIERWTVGVLSASSLESLLNA